MIGKPYVSITVN